MTHPKILFIIGSLRKESANRLLAKKVADYLSPHAEISYLDYSDLPIMNPDIEFPVPAPVKRIRQAVTECDGIWIFFPEYNHSYPGVLKNLLDWISRPVEQGAPRTTAVSSGVPVTYSSISGSGGAVKAFQKMDDLMAKIHMENLDIPRAAFSDPAIVDGSLVLDAGQESFIRKQADAFLRSL